MDIKNWKLKRTQSKAMAKADDLGDYLGLMYSCPKCYFKCDTLEGYTKHLESHLINKKRKKNRR